MSGGEHGRQRKLAIARCDYHTLPATTLHTAAMARYVTAQSIPTCCCESGVVHDAVQNLPAAAALDTLSGTTDLRNSGRTGNNAHKHLFCLDL